MEMPSRTFKRTSINSSRRLSPHVVHGYEAPFLWHVAALLLVAALCANEFVLHELAIPHAVLLAIAAMSLLVHEVLRACAESCSDVALMLVRICTSVSKALVQHARRGFRPQFQGWSGAFHLFQAAMATVATQHGHTIIWLHNAQKFRRNADWFGRAQGWLSCRLYGSTLERIEFNGLEHLWLRFNGDGDDDEATPIVLLYLHGGGNTGMSPRVYTDFCNRLCAAVREQLQDTPSLAGGGSRYTLQVLIANYRKMPEVLYPIPVDDCVVMYEYLRTQKQVPAQNIILAGDSAGAGLVLSTLLRLRGASDADTDAAGGRQAMPLAAICSCPFVDFSGFEAFSQHCIMHAPVPDVIRDFCRVAPDEGDSDAWREAHIVERDLSSLPPLFVQTGAFDTFHQHALKLAAKAEEDGVQGVELDVHDEMPHVFSAFPAWLLPGSERGVANMAAFIVKRLQVLRGEESGREKAGDAVESQGDARTDSHQRARSY